MAVWRSRCGRQRRVILFNLCLTHSSNENAPVYKPKVEEALCLLAGLSLHNIAFNVFFNFCQSLVSLINFKKLSQSGLKTLNFSVGLLVISIIFHFENHFLQFCLAQNRSKSARHFVAVDYMMTVSVGLPIFCI